ncbi:MAG: sodium:proton antiporter [Gammaproteobacteria bacterium]|nr:sodium:proton antiporter [Gammaproteobacteria bacterium]
MSPYSIGAIILTLAVLIGYLNHRFVKIQSTIAIMTGSMLLSFVLIILQHTRFAGLSTHLSHLVAQTDFKNLLLKGMLGFLLFAGSLGIDFNILKSHRWEISTLASISTIASTLIIGVLSYYLLPLIGLKLPLLYCLLFGALISPTDPIAVLATFKEVGAPKKLEVCVAGESLFNDGVGIVIFTTLLALTFDHVKITAANVSFLFLQQAIGGIVYGIVLGLITHTLIRSVTDYTIMILITLAAVTGGYEFALSLNISGPLAMVVAGIFVGNKGRRYEAKQTYLVLTTFWEVIDELLNAILFLMIGLELLTLKASELEIIAAISAIPLILLVRFLTVAAPLKIFPFKLSGTPYTIRILTWGGLRGGLAVALALSLPHGPSRNLILVMTYAVVAFAVIVQGLSVKPIARKAKEACQ